ncbi:MAG: hypothetical protein ABIS36_14610 [Chryseolinea sp.]
MSEVMGDLQTRRSIIMGISGNDSHQVIKARTPLAALDRYSTTRRLLPQAVRALLNISLILLLFPEKFRKNFQKIFRRLK